MDDKSWEDNCEMNRLGIRNDDRPTHCMARHDSMRESVIDLTLDNRPFGKTTILDVTNATESDHQIIEWELEQKQPAEAGGTLVVGWNLAAMSQKDMEVAEELCRKSAKERAHLRAESTGDEVKSDPEWCQEALSKVLDTPAEQITISAHSKRWWNGEILEKRSQLGREKRRRRCWQ